MHIRTHIHHPWSAEFASFLKMSNLTIENLFQKTLADVKAALETVSEQCLMKVWSKHLYERGSHVVLLYAGPQKPFSTSDSISLWGHFPKKGRLISKGKNYVLYHRDTFLDEFQNKSPEEVIILSKKLLGISGGERSKKNMTIPEPVKSLPDDVGSDGKERGELQPPLTFVEQSQTEIFEEDPEVENEAASKEADGNEPIEHAAASIDNANAAASIENEGKYIM